MTIDAMEDLSGKKDSLKSDIKELKAIVRRLQLEKDRLRTEIHELETIYRQKQTQ